MQFDLRHLATELNGTVIGDPETLITGVAGADTADEGDLVFAEAPRFFEQACRGRASAILVTQDLAAASDKSPKPLIVVDRPRVAFVHVLRMFAPAPQFGAGIHESVQIGAGTQFGEAVHIAPYVVLGKDVLLGDGVVLLSGVTVGDRCSIGAGTIVHPNAVLYPGVRIGRGCILHAGCVIGADGFGYVPVGHGLLKVPHLGTVEIGDEVEIGANTCIDRAKTGVTRIGSGTKIDNLVHIAHNVSVGQACLIIAQAGVAGSVTIGNGVVLAGQAGIKDHVVLGDGARVAAQGGVIGDVASGTTVSGYPARPHQEKMRELGALTALPDALKRLRVLEKRLAAFEETISGERRPSGQNAREDGNPAVVHEADGGQPGNIA